jgi:hypothetical protein
MQQRDQLSPVNANQIKVRRGLRLHRVTPLQCTASFGACESVLSRILIKREAALPSLRPIWCAAGKTAVRTSSNFGMAGQFRARYA